MTGADLDAFIDLANQLTAGAASLLAAATAPTTGPGVTETVGKPPPGPFAFLVQFGPIILIILVFYIFVFRGKRKQDRQRNDMLAALKKGDRVQTIGGILGTVIEAREHDVLLKVDETNNTKIRFARSAIHRVVDEDKAEAK